ncbi:2,3-bisphosphoglycerate-independent phosphoglycerate mutase [Amycolatopsis ultiminotia]|uniref:2,3-bisphosphoglycerate-independent phosphoglycerate mutase n=1 Tax=Amycolatopsis ultiminotia TaxID=543629 RepID=A0ABP6V206_9PSEU
MSPLAYGEAQPRPVDDRMPIVLVVLDGLGDRPIAELGDRTPAEAAWTPNLDRLAAAGATGWHLPFGWGRAPSSELAHWSMFGFGDVVFPGRAVLEALGAGLDVPSGVAVSYAALRPASVRSDRVWITGRAKRVLDDEDAAALYHEVGPVLETHGLAALPVGRQGESVLVAPEDASGAVTDTDPFFEDIHPWLYPVETLPEGAPFARRLARALPDVRAVLLGSEVNAARRARGIPALDVLTTKWSGTRRQVPGFADRAGVIGAAVTSTPLYRGLATLLGMPFTHLRAEADPAVDLRQRIAAAEQLIADGARFVHVHSKATDEAGHTKDPYAKHDTLEAVDRGLGGLLGLADRAVVAVTGDHATPSTHGLLHAGEPTPLIVAGPTVRADEVTSAGERATRYGWHGRISADDLLPLLLSYANRPAFLGHRTTPVGAHALPDAPKCMPAGPEPHR